MKWSVVAGCMILTGGMAHAQDRPFVFSITTPGPKAETQARVDVDLGVGEGAFRASQANGPEQRIGVQVSKGRLTAIGRFDIASNTAASTYDTSQSAELLVSFAPRGLALAAGGGVLHEAGGADVLLGRVIAGRVTDRWRLDGNVVFQKPYGEAGRDAVDLLTTVGWTRKVSASVAVGVEAIGEDLEGFWEAVEAEGGARFLAGPSVHIAPRGKKWQLTATGGPTFHPADTGRASGALRDLPASTGRVGYAVRTAFTISVF